MSRRQRRRTAIRARWISWKPVYAELFGLVAQAWTPPRRIRVTTGLRRRTITAVFIAEDGARMTARVRLARRSGEDWNVTAEELALPVMKVGFGS